MPNKTYQCLIDDHMSVQYHGLRRGIRNLYLGLGKIFFLSALSLTVSGEDVNSCSPMVGEEDNDF